MEGGEAGGWWRGGGGGAVSELSVTHLLTSL